MSLKLSNPTIDVSKNTLSMFDIKLYDTFIKPGSTLPLRPQALYIVIEKGTDDEGREFIRVKNLCKSSTGTKASDYSLKKMTEGTKDDTPVLAASLNSLEVEVVTKTAYKYRKKAVKKSQVKAQKKYKASKK